MTACGGDSGVDSSKRLSELTTEEAKDACLEAVADFPPRTVTCDSVSITFGKTAEDCNGAVPGESCTATVGDARACAEAMAALTEAQICMDGPLPAACMKIVGC